MFTEKLPGLYGASFPPRAPFTELSRNDQLTKRWNKTQAIPLPHWKYIFVLFLRSVNSALFCSPSFKGNLIPSRPGGRSRSQPAFWLTSLWISFTIPACHRLSSVNEKNLFHTLYFPCKETLGVFAEIHSLVGRWKPPFCAHTSPSP